MEVIITMNVKSKADLLFYLAEVKNQINKKFKDETMDFDLSREGLKEEFSYEVTINVEP